MYHSHFDLINPESYLRADPVGIRLLIFINTVFTLLRERFADIIFKHNNLIVFHHPLLGYNYKMSDIHASIGTVQLKKLDQYIKKKRGNVAYLNGKLDDLSLKLPGEEDYAFNVYYVYHVLVSKEKEEFTQFLNVAGIETRPLLSFIPEQPPYRRQYDANVCPVARDAHQRGFYVSNSPSLTTEALDFLVSALREALTGR